MGQSAITVKAPGKLMIAGEYAVLEQYQRLVVTAVDRYVEAVIADADENILHLTDLDLLDVKWERTDDTVVLQADDPRIKFVQKALELSTTYIIEQDIVLTPVRITIKSELDDASGVKYGLGSSAAVTTAVVSAILHKFLPEKPTDDEIFKVSAIAHALVQGNGSGADVAAAAYGGWLEYASYQIDWLLEEYEKAKTLSRLVKRNWQYMKLEHLEEPEDLHMVVGWTGKAANTKDYVAKIQKMKHASHVDFAEFMVQSATAVQGILHGMKDNKIDLFNEGISLNRAVLQRLGRDADAVIETAELKTLCDLAEEFGGVAKPSGAGGGDCGIAFMPDAASVKKVRAAWEAAGITPLDLTPEVKK